MMTKDLSRQLCELAGIEAKYYFKASAGDWVKGTKYAYEHQSKDDKWKVIYPNFESAEQRERLEELILNLGRLSYHKSDIYYICILSRVNNANNGMAGTRPQALYALTHKLVSEGVIGKEEVKEALTNV